MASALGVHEASAAMLSAAMSASSRFLICSPFDTTWDTPLCEMGVSLSIPVPAGAKTSLWHGRRSPELLDEDLAPRNGSFRFWNPLDSALDPLEIAPDPLDSAPDPLEIEPDPLDSSLDPLEIEPDPLDSAPDPLGFALDLLDSALERLDSGREAVGCAGEESDFFSRQSHLEPCSALRPISRRDRPPVPFDDRLDDGEA